MSWALKLSSGPGTSQIGEQEVQAPWGAGHGAGQVEPSYCARTCVWAWSRDICNRPGSPHQALYWSPFLGSWAPRGEPFRGRAGHSGGCRGRPPGRSAQRGAPEASACERRVGIYCILSRATKAHLLGPARPSLFAAGGRKQARPRPRAAS